MPQNKIDSKPPIAPRVKSDEFFKDIMSTEVVAQQFLNEYLPSVFKQIIDFSSLKIEKDSYINDDLKKRMSDTLYSFKTNDNESAFAYVLIEHQSNLDKDIAIRLWEYMFLIMKNHRCKITGKFPIIAPIVFYNGRKKYTCARNLWNMFHIPELAKILMLGDYGLVNLQAMDDEDIYKKHHLGMMEIFMKNIHQRDQRKIWGKCLEHFDELMLIDEENGFLYIKKFIRYTLDKTPVDERQKLIALFKNKFHKKGENVMRSVLGVEYENGYYKGIDAGVEKGMGIGLEQGLEQGFVIGIEKTAITMMQHKFDLLSIANITGLSIDKLIALSNKR